MKISPNAPCPCGSGGKYKKCCQRYHKGALAPDALTLMRSRYSAYAAGSADYIIKTTHPNHPDHALGRSKWKEEILTFSKHTDFLSLHIIDYLDGETEAYVTFEAKLSSGLLKEKSRFLKEDEQWLYVDGEYEKA
jgi:SEC-C motif-containing protein